MQVGYKLVTEAFEPKEIVRQAVEAERAGFDFVDMSDHYHPWLYSLGHSGFVWSMLGAAAAKTNTIGLVTGVTCPSIRIHPAIIAQAAATTAILSEGRFTLGVGSGERLNEHVVGGAWPAVRVRHRMLRESIEIIRLLWSGGNQSYEGKYLTLDEARVFDLPDVPPAIAVAAGGPASVRLAAELGDGLFTTRPKLELLRGYAKAGGSGPKYASLAMSWARDEHTAVESAHRLLKFGVLGWNVLTELKNTADYESVLSFVRPEDVSEAITCGPEVQQHVEAARAYVDAGVDHLTLQNAGPDVDAFFEFFSTELSAPLRALARS
ncbi:TIGR03557 family F420-dependent LLM class oxidoreductase [Rhodococcus spongiicola]|uniref:TIGR03557 family F420-dependent LLM class oxidoreductase n=1 Tax=Rhodococcus spongiicola TaxID=2487352 RepID=A0A438AQS2_9NOCA|nr:TIGR03557 family F420-dependent LLM class oxidoreductase [Rhodococcus spongiicola]RVW00894.1 TIGR03557 family F420-dependent LLM class oxidoreductase [Rhodococcus spongiicola]